VQNKQLRLLEIEIGISKEKQILQILELVLEFLKAKADSKHNTIITKVLYN
jgi:hypothetical protein